MPAPKAHALAVIAASSKEHNLPQESCLITPLARHKPAAAADPHGDDRIGAVPTPKTSLTKAIAAAAGWAKPFLR